MQANGVWSESFFVGVQSIGPLQSEQRDEILALFPDLQVARAHARLARPDVKLFEGKVLAGMLQP